MDILCRPQVTWLAATLSTDRDGLLCAAGSFHARQLYWRHCSHEVVEYTKKPSGEFRVNSGETRLFFLLLQELVFTMEQEIKDCWNTVESDKLLVYVRCSQFVIAAEYFSFYHWIVYDEWWYHPDVFCLCFLQDTVVALQALAYYAAFSGANAIDLRFNISSPGSSFVSLFHINSTNYRMYHSQQVSEGETVWNLSLVVRLTD